MSSASTTDGLCPKCGSSVSGKFCSQCGASSGGATCASCRAALTPGARFCHRCGTAAGSTPNLASGGSTQVSGGSNALPWAFAAIALLAFAAYVAAQRFGAVSIPGANAATATAPGMAGLQPSAGDISSLSPEEQADRLHDRVMRLYEEGKADSVQFFAPMAISAYQMLPDLNAHRRYDMGRIADVSGEFTMARAQADTILAAVPNHLLGLILASRVAEQEGRQADLAGYTERLLNASESELAQVPQREEYELHANDINIALVEARRR